MAMLSSRKIYQKAQKKSLLELWWVLECGFCLHSLDLPTLHTVYNCFQWVRNKSLLYSTSPKMEPHFLRVIFKQSHLRLTCFVKESQNNKSDFSIFKHHHKWLKQYVITLCLRVIQRTLVQLFCYSLLFLSILCIPKPGELLIVSKIIIIIHT